MSSQINVRTKLYSTWYLYIESYKDDINFKTQNSQKNQEDEAVVFQKSRCKILTYTRLFEQNNDHMQISHEIEFCSSSIVIEVIRTVFIIIFIL